MPSPGQFVTTLVAAVLAAPLGAQQPKPAPEPAAQLARDVIWNELHDRDLLNRWEYSSTRTAAGQTLVRERIETSEGPVSRVLGRNGVPLTAAEQHRESQRIEAYIHDPSAIARKRRDREQDEERLASIMKIIPDAFVFQYQGSASGDIARLSFRPNPAFVASGYDARIVHSLAGMMTVNLRYKRLIDIRGMVSQPVDIGYGILGSVSPGGTFEIHRCQVSASEWKTDLVDIHVRGRLLVLKGVGKDEREVSSDFHPVPRNLTLTQADSLLRQAAGGHPLQARMGGAATGAPQGAQAATASISSDP